MQRRSGLALLLLVTLALAVGCASKRPAEMVPGSGGSAKQSAPGEAPASPVPQSARAQDAHGNVFTSNSVAVADSSKPVPPPGTPPQPGGNAVPETGVAQRKEIKNANFELKVKNVDEADQKLRAALQAAGGFIQNSQVDGQKENGRRMTIQLRVPAAGYTSTFTAISGLGEEITRREWTTDVTQEYFDLEARIKVQEAHAEQLKGLYAKTGTIPEMIQLEQEIARVQADLDSLKGRYTFLSNQVSFSTIAVTMYEPGAPTPLKPATSVRERLSRGFVGSWNGMVNFGGDLVVFLVSAVPVVVPLGLLALAGYLGFRAIRRRRGPGGPGSPSGAAPVGPSGNDPTASVGVGAPNQE